MNALTRRAMNVVLPRARATAARSRPMAVESRAHLHKDIPTNLEQLKNNIWLSDPGAYPVIGVLTGALAMCGSYMAYCALTNPDVRVAPGRRQALVRTWD